MTWDKSGTFPFNDRKSEYSLRQGLPDPLRVRCCFVKRSYYGGWECQSLKSGSGYFLSPSFPCFWYSRFVGLLTQQISTWLFTEELISIILLSGWKSAFALGDILVPRLLPSLHMWRAQCLLLHHCLHQTISWQVENVYRRRSWSFRISYTSKKCFLGKVVTFRSREFRNALLRALWSLFVIGDATAFEDIFRQDPTTLIAGLLFVFKFLLCNKLDEKSKLEFSEVKLDLLVLCFL